MFTSIGKREKKVKEKMANKAHRVGKLIGPSGGKIAPFYTLRHSINNIAFF